MEYLLVIILCLHNFHRIDYSAMNRATGDIVGALSLVGLVTASMGFVSSFFQLLGWINSDTIASIAVYLALHTPLIASMIAGLIILSRDYDITSYFNQLISAINSKIKAAKLKQEINSLKSDNKKMM